MNEQQQADAANGPQGAVGEAAEGVSPLLRNVRTESAGVVLADLPLDPNQDPFLTQHRLRGKSLLPVVVGLEALLEAATLAGQRRVIGFRDVDMIDGLMFHSPEAMTVQARAALSGPGIVHCCLSGDLRSRAGKLIQKDRPYLKASAELGDSAALLATNIPAAVGEWREFPPYPDDAPMYHGPPFRGVVAGCYTEPVATARVMALPLVDLVGAGREKRWTIPSVVLDSAMYACGLHLWFFHGHLIALPKSIGQLRFGRQPRTGEACLVHMVCREAATDRAVYDFDIVGDDGALILQVRGYGKVVIGVGAMG